MPTKSSKTEEPTLEEKIKDFRSLMRQIREYGGEGEEGGLKSESEKRCLNCGSGICQMVQDSNGLQCYKLYK